MISKTTAKEETGKSSSGLPAAGDRSPGQTAAPSPLPSGNIRTGRGPLSAGSLVQMQRAMGNRALGQWLGGDRSAAAAGFGSSSGGVVQRKVVTGSRDATLDDVLNYFLENDVEQGIDDRDLKREFNKESEKDRELTIEQFLTRINAFGDSESDEGEDEDWDPADQAAEPMDPDGVLSSDVRRSLSFNSNAKNYMKLDTPKDKSGHYVCHICQGRISKGESVDMDHLPPWKERLHAFIESKDLTENDYDELTGPAMKQLYNMRGSVFAHSSCNRNHSGEGNYKKKWKTALNWYESGGGSPF